ncbi:hypothetical protein BCV69DRAFT_162201 [Microstroma glucosiphilum]|uniref:Ser-Thr-rich glycosyl-phosphatidyl-inositol-anchored membrane family-domain-containing protein n=1 Tax=Pseudomicrostroma glucosiphilum TaxID=1684307 RepID=A0A316UAZ4_9BASI|nr:hypothetical protein BCV69DRAFT_162201 [Pseudomicrostroma glucosiphilum]PWN22014.1 hypothetical protein BCV69DRAFT_162201 [Pseudomicrostroma glucosiphilum]
MKTFSAISGLAAVGIAAITYVRAQATVQSPANLIECQPAAITWSGASGSVYLSVVLGDDVSSAAYVSFPTQSGASGSYTWSKVNVTSGQTVTFIVNDSTGAPNYSSQVTVNAGSDTSCLSSSSSSDSDSSSTSSAAAAAGTSSAASGSSSKSGSSSTSSAAAAASSTAASSGASKSSLNALAVVGAAFAGAAFLA